MDEREIIERLSRLMKAVGADLTQLSYRKAFPRLEKNVALSAPKVDEDTMPQWALDQAHACISLKKLYKQYPTIKRSGFPSGYPRGKSLAVQTDWCRRKALQILKDQIEANHKLAAEAEAAKLAAVEV
jgi:hypothetical protein